jgi:hypothetical protein
MLKSSRRTLTLASAGVILIFSITVAIAQQSSDKSASDGSARPSAAPRQAKKVWTNDDIPSRAGDSGGSSPASGACAGATSPLHASQGFGQKYGPAEQQTLEEVVAIYHLERASCVTWLARACSLEELRQTVKDSKGRIIGMARDRRDNTEYQFNLTVSGKQWEPTPRHVGLGGFQADDTGVRVNPAGAATKNDKLATYDLNLKDILCDSEPPGRH